MLNLAMWPFIDAVSNAPCPLLCRRRALAAGQDNSDRFQSERLSPLSLMSGVLAPVINLANFYTR
jgi:hypothetical protein